MLSISGISYFVDGRPLFDHASADIPAGHKIGLVGRNGAGKTTLFRLIRGELVLEDGEILLPQGSRIGSVAQEAPSGAASLLDTVLGADIERTDLLAEADSTIDPMRIAEVQTRLADIDAWSAEARASIILNGLGFDSQAQGRPCSDFSGGWRMRVALAGVLFAQPDILLLDEPTNYLDLEGAIWLENYLQNYAHTVIIISHDRALLNRAVGAILHLEDGSLALYSGPYDQFARQRAEQYAVRTATAKKQDMQRAHLQDFVDRFRYQANKARQAQSRLKMLERMVPISAPEDRAAIAFSFPEPEEMSPPLITLENAAVGYDGSPVLKAMNLRIDPDDRIALLGRNGEGKSTLSKLLAGKLPLASGTMAKSGELRIGYFAQHQVDELRLDESPLQHLERLHPDEGKPRLRSRLAGFGLGADHAEAIVDRLSGGQKARLSMVMATLDAPHLLILDEPTNHLDIESREALVDVLTTYSGAVILVSHDMHLLGLVADRLWLVNAGTVTPYEDDMDSYRSFLLGAAAPDAPSAVKAASLDKPPREMLARLKAEVRTCETRIAKLNDMRDKLALKLADPGLYEPEMGSQAQTWQMKYAEVIDGLDRAEALWIAALQELEAAQREP